MINGEFLVVKMSRLTTLAIFPLAFPAAARVDVLPAGGAKLSVVCLALADAWVGLLVVALLLVF